MNLESVTIKALPWKIRDLAQAKKEDRIHLPDLQRGFVWTPERVRALHDSLYRKYPVGALLLWKPTWQGDDAPFTVRSWDIFRPNANTGRGEPEPKPRLRPGALFVLDGQQRLTSLFRVIFQGRIRGKTTADPDLLVALSPDESWVENPFHLRSRQIMHQMREGLLVAAEVLFAGIRGEDESLAIQGALGEWVRTEDKLFFKALDRANSIRNAILTAEIVAYEIDAEADDDNVIEIFARLNQQGVRLRPGDLAAARLTGRMKDFRERARLALGKDDLRSYAALDGEEDRARSGAFVDTDLIVRTSLFLGTGVLRYRDIEKRKKGAEDDAYQKVESVWEQACDGLTRAVAVFKAAGIPDGTWLPYRYLLLPPAVYAAKGHPLQSDLWLGWAIAASLWGHYAGSAETKAQADAKAAADSKTETLFDNLKLVAKRTESLIPDDDDFLQAIPLEAGAMLALLVSLLKNHGRSFPSGKFLHAKAEPIEVHHIFPREALNRAECKDSSNNPDRLGNLTAIYRTDNEFLSDSKPSEYLPKSSPGDLAAHGIPNQSALWDITRYTEFCDARERLLASVVRELLSSLGVK